MTVHSKSDSDEGPRPPETPTRDGMPHGIWREWYANGQLKSELPFIDGALVGRQIVYADDGEVLAEAYWVNNCRISRKKYEEARKSDPSLPEYAARTTSKTSPSRNPPSSRPVSSVDDEFLQSLVDDENTTDALAWLQETDVPPRSLGESSNLAASIDLTEALYALGAIKVHAIEIVGAPDEPQNSGKIIIQVPERPAMRRKLFAFVGEIAIEMGFDPEIDTGQRLLLIMLD